LLTAPFCDLYFASTPQWCDFCVNPQCAAFFADTSIVVVQTRSHLSAAFAFAHLLFHVECMICLFRIYNAKYQAAFGVRKLIDCLLELLLECLLELLHCCSMALTVV